MPNVSIITPTFNLRHAFLPTLWDCIRAQSFQDFEWLVCDDSPVRAPLFDTINDPRVSCIRLPAPTAIGAKRNALCAAAKANIIVHFDDDDFYARSYVAQPAPQGASKGRRLKLTVVRRIGAGHSDMPKAAARA
jgi:glycosyltransferase involved in cell wall biosynthesis